MDVDPDLRLRAQGLALQTEGAARATLTQAAERHAAGDADARHGAAAVASRPRPVDHCWYAGASASSGFLSPEGQTAQESLRTEKATQWRPHRDRAGAKHKGPHANSPISQIGYAEFVHLYNTTNFKQNAVGEFVEGLKYSGLPSVDAFLERQPAFLEIGKAELHDVVATGFLKSVAVLN
jgi:hypothetical protein